MVVRLQPALLFSHRCGRLNRRFHTFPKGIWEKYVSISFSYEWIVEQTGLCSLDRANSLEEENSEFKTRN